MLYPGVTVSKNKMPGEISELGALEVVSKQQRNDKWTKQALSSEHIMVKKVLHDKSTCKANVAASLKRVRVKMYTKNG